MTSSSLELRRPISLPRATALVVGTIIGASIFVQPSAVSGEVPQVTGMLLVWAAAGALTLVGALVTAELASAFPRTGGVYVFLTEAFSPLVGFLWCWAMFWSMHTGIIAALATVFARYAGHFVPLGDRALRVVAIAAILALSAINYVSVRQGSALQAAFTAIKVAGAAYLVLLGAQTLIAAARGSRRHAPAVRGGSRRALRQGVVSNLGNPKMAVFFPSLLPQFAASPSFVSLLILGLVFCSLTLAWLTAYAVAVARARALFERRRVRRLLDAITGAALVALGLRLAID